MKLIPLLIALMLPTIAAAEAVWKQDGNRSLELVDGDITLLRFILDAPAPKDPHFEVLATSDGRNTVWVGPADHVWHYGMWFSWKYINKVNFWETQKVGDDPQARMQAGRNEILEPEIISEPGAATATIRYREMSHPQREGEAVLEDRVEIRITKPQGEMGLRVDWDMKTTALADVVLDRTPPPGSGEPGAKGYGGYGGFSWRGPGTFRELVYLDSENRKDMEIHRQHAAWLNVNGKLEEREAGLLFVNHPENPRHPTSWYVFHQGKKHTFWYVNPALLQDKPMELAKGESFTHRYRVQLHDGSWTTEKCKLVAAELVK